MPNKKNHKVVIYYLLVQIVFGGLLMYGAFSENSGWDALLVAIPLYLGLAVAFTLFAILRYKFTTQRELRGAYGNCITATIFLWIVAWPIGLEIYEVMPRIDFEWRAQGKTLEVNRFKLAQIRDRLGLPQCADANNCEVKFADGGKFILNIQGDDLKASCP